MRAVLIAASLCSMVVCAAAQTPPRPDPGPLTIAGQGFAAGKRLLLDRRLIAQGARHQARDRIHDYTSRFTRLGGSEEGLTELRIRRSDWPILFAEWLRTILQLGFVRQKAASFVTKSEKSHLRFARF